MATVKQAPNMWGIAPDIAAQQADLQRRQQMVDMLRKENDSHPLDTQYVTGAGPARAVPISNFQGLAKLLQDGLGAYEQYKINNESNDLSKRTAEAQNQQFEKQWGKSAPAGQSPVSNTYNAPDGTTIGDTGSQSVPMTAPQTQKDDVYSDLKRAAYAEYLRGNMEGYNKLLGNRFEITNDQKNMNAMGQDPIQMGKYATAEAKKKGMLEMQPNNTVLDLSNNQRMVAPDFKAGVAGGYSPNGMPVMSNIAGSNVIPEMAGQVKRAEAAGSAGYDMVTVNTPDGPIMMTKENAANYSSGKPISQPQNNNPSVPNGGFPAGTQSPSPTQGQQSQLDIFNQEKEGILARPDNDPRKAGDLAAINREIQKIQGKNTQGNQQPMGIKLQDEAGVEQGKGKGKFFSDTYSELQKQAMASNQTVAKYNRLSNLLDGIETGKFTGNALEIKKAAKAAGIDLGVADNVPALEAARALTSELSLIARNPDSGLGMPGAMSDADRSFLVNMQPGIETTPQGRKLQLEAVVKMEKRKQDIAKLARGYKNGELDNGFFDVMQKYSEENPMFIQENKQVQPQTSTTNPSKVDYASRYGIKTK